MRRIFAAGLACALCALLAPALFAHDPKCGDVVGTPGTDVPFVLTLSDNIGPCPGNGLVLQGRYMTINLNNRTLFAAPGNTGIGIWSEYPMNTVINGPGRIEGFGFGIRLGLHQSAAIVQNVQLANNSQIGIYVIESGAISSSNGLPTLHIRQNTITGGGTGIRVAESGDVKIWQNTISGQKAAGIALVAVTRVTVINNTLTGNQDGLIGDSIHLGFSSVKVLLNHFDNNVLDGMRIQGSLGGLNNEYVGNFASGNGRDGFNLPYRGGRVEDNVAMANQNYGFLAHGENLRVIENKAANNRVQDLFLDTANAPGVCFKYNQFGTSNVTSLTPCS